MSKNIPLPKTREEITVSWMNQIFAKNENPIVVSKLSWLGDANNGIGAMSSMERVKVTLQNGNEISLIIKTLPTEPNLRSYVSANGFASREVNMYTKIIPDMERFIEERSGRKENWFRHPKCYFGAEEGKEDDYNMILILEDLIDSKFQRWEDGPNRPLDWGHASTSIKEIARFHAVSFAYRTVNKIQNFLDIYPFLMDFKNEHDPNLDMYLDSGLEVVEKIFVDMESAGEIVPEGLRETLLIQRQTIVKEVIIPNLILQPDNINSLCHNDLHTNNVFFSEENDGGLEAVWFDFQACFDGPPMKDLTFFLLMCCDFSLSSTELPKTITRYHEIFSGVLSELDVPENSYPYERMKMDFEKFLLQSTWHIIASGKFFCVRPEFRQVLKTLLIGMYELGLMKNPE